MPSGLPQPTGADYFGAPWHDVSAYFGNLIPSEQAVLSTLKDASIYRMDVRIATDFLSLEGHEEVRYTNQEKTYLDCIYFQLFPTMSGGRTEVSDVTVNGDSVVWMYDFNGGALRVELPEFLLPGNSAVIGLNFMVNIPNTTCGYGIFGYTQGIMALNSFYPAIPVFDDSGWHAGPYPSNSDNTFQDASLYLVRVAAPSAITLVGSGSEVDRAKDKDRDIQTVTFAAGPARDFYLAGSADFTLVSRSAGSTTIKCYSLPGEEAGAEAALDIAAAAIQTYSSRLGDYPYTELDIVPLDLLSGALGIEYPGVAGISAKLFSQSQGLETTIVHELAHQWFYNIVGNDQINEPWLDEAMAQYCTGLYYLHVYGDAGWQGLEQSWEARWNRVNRADIPIGLPAGNYSGSQYGAVVYGRGPLFIEALSRYMGPDNFGRFLNKYCQANRWQIINNYAFQLQAQDICQCDLGPMFDEWVNP